MNTSWLSLQRTSDIRDPLSLTATPDCSFRAMQHSTASTTPFPRAPSPMRPFSLVVQRCSVTVFGSDCKGSSCHSTRIALTWSSDAQKKQTT
eukprot:14403-Rhodomonas_salina.2